jgi:hypothetical protein
MMPVITPLKGKFVIVSPSAASVPSAVAKKVVAKAMMKLFFMDRVHMTELKNSINQRKLKPGMG